MDGFDRFADQNVIIVYVSMCNSGVQSQDYSITKCIWKIFFIGIENHVTTCIIELQL